MQVHETVSDRYCFISEHLCCRPSACLSVTLLHPTQPVEIFGTVSTSFGTMAIRWHSWKILRRSCQGNPSIGGIKLEGWPNIAILDLSKAISRKRCKIWRLLVLITNRKSYYELSIGTKIGVLEW